MTNGQSMDFMRGVDDYLYGNHRFRVWGGHGDHISGMSNPEFISPKLWASKYTNGPVDVFTDGGKLTGPLIDMYAKFHRP